METAIKSKTLSPSELFGILTAHFNPLHMEIKKIDLNTEILIYYTEGYPMDIPDKFVLSIFSEHFYLPDKGMIKDHLRDILKSMGNKERVILSVIFGIDQKAAKTYKEAMVTLANQGIEYPTNRKLSLRETELRAFVKKKLKEVYKPTILSFSDDELLSVPAADIHNMTGTPKFRWNHVNTTAENRRSWLSEKL